MLFRFRRPLRGSSGRLRTGAAPRRATSCGSGQRPEAIPPRPVCSIASAACVLLVLTVTAEAGQGAPPIPKSVAAPAAPDANGADTTDLPFTYDGPPPPRPPEIVTRDSSGRMTIRAVRLSAPLRVDGRLDDEIYTLVPPVGDMLQIEPKAGTLASEQTDVWVTYDDKYVYVTARCWESQPDRMVLNEMRRDNNALFRNDNLGIVFDTFYDRRNGAYFGVTAIGARVDGQITNERAFNVDWNPVWNVEVGRFDGGWIAEMAIPFKTLRYRPGRAQIWSFNVQRENWGLNEISVLTPMPAALGARGLMQISLAPTLVGIEAPPPRRTSTSSRTSCPTSRAISPARRASRTTSARAWAST